MEVRKLGVSSKVHHLLIHNEVVDIQSMLKRHKGTADGHSTSPVWNYGCVASLNFQFHLIARIDDTMNVKMENLRQSSNFSYLLQTRLNFSNNVREEMRLGS